MSECNLKIALTGAMGSGKSQVAEFFRGLGARVVNADEISRGLLEPSAQGWSALVAEFGERFLQADQTVDRPKLRAAIFSDEALRVKVNSMLHPLIRAAINEICTGNSGCKSAAANGVVLSRITIVEVPLLFEVGWQDDFDWVIVVAADKETCLGRIMSRDSVDRHAAMTAFASQMSLAEKAKMADYLIDNNGDLGVTARQVEELYRSLSANL